MSTIPRGTRQFLLDGLAVTPNVLGLIEGKFPDGPAWNIRKDPDRFTAREVVAHLADWEEVFQRRIGETLTGSTKLFNLDPWILRDEKGYGSIPVRESIVKFLRVRQATLLLFNDRIDKDWELSSLHPTRGPMTLEAQVVHISAHDGYHIHQLFDLLERPAGKL